MPLIDSLKQFLIGWYLLANVFCHGALPSHLKNVDELFRNEFRIYSPLNGLLNHTSIQIDTENTDEAELLNQIKSALFITLNEGEVIPTHIFSNPAANLFGSTIAKIFVEFEQFKSLFTEEIKKGYEKEFQGYLEERFLEVIVTDDAYGQSLAQAKVNQEVARTERIRIEKLIKDQDLAEKKADEFKRKEIAPICTQIKALKRQKKAEDDPSLMALEQKKVELLKIHDQMRAAFLKSNEKAQALSKLDDQIEANETNGPAYEKKLHDLIRALAQGFIYLDLPHRGHNEYSNATTNALLSFLWMKLDDKAALAPYLNVLAKNHFFEPKPWSKVNDEFYRNYYNEKDYKELLSDFSSSWSKSKWVSDNFAAGVALVTDIKSQGEDEEVPKLVSFNYASWVRYSPLFADCTENAIHNIFNLFAFNKRTKEFDADILRKLKADYYPNFSDAVINFYATYKTDAEHNSKEAKIAWIEILTGLNDGFINLTKEQRIRYVRPRSELNASFQNILRVVNRLFGFEDWLPDNLSSIFQNVKRVSNYEVRYTRSDKEDTFQRATFEIGHSKFQLTSFGNLHCTYKTVVNLDEKNIQELIKILRDKWKTHGKVGDWKTIRYLSVSRYLSALD